LSTLARARRRRREGAAIVEAVIMLPVLGILFVGTLFIGRAYLAHQRALVAARSCAFEYAVNGCRNVPVTCTGLTDNAQSEDGQRHSAALLATTRARVPGGIDVFEEIPVLGDALSGLFGTTARVQVPVALRLPWSQEQTVRVDALIALACNEHPRSVTSEIERMLHEYLPIL
jgi:hypothetical protein